MERSEILFKDAIISVLAIFLGLFIPFPVIFLAYLFGYSELLEEVVKGLVVILLISSLSTNRRRICWAFIFGLIFGLSEAMFYLAQAYASGTVDHFWMRFVSTVPLHALTASMIILPIVMFRRRVWGIIGLVLALALHLAYNFYLAV